LLSEQTQKQLLLVSGIISGFGGIIGAITALAGNFTDLFTKIDALHRMPLWAIGVTSGSLLLLGLWLLVKWRTRHSRLLKPDALRLDRDNAEHLVGRIADINNLFEQCVLKQIIFLEGESGSGKSALVRSGLLPKLRDNRSILPLLLPDLWVDHWERGPAQGLKIAMINSGAFANERPAEPIDEYSTTSVLPLSSLEDIASHLVRLNNEETRTPLIIFDQFDDYQARNRERFLPNKTWLNAAALRRENSFWEMVASLLEKEKLRTLFITRSDTAAGLNSVQFLGPVEALRLDRVPSQYITELLTRLTEGTPSEKIIADPEFGWNRLRDRIIRDISQQDVVLPQQLKIMLGGIQSLKQLNIAQYERAGGASGIEALYVEQQISGTSRKVGLETDQVRAILVTLIDPLIPTKTRSCSREEVSTAAAKVTGKAIGNEKLDKVLAELERGEMLRSTTDPNDGQIAYRLDHDYLTRGVSAAERRANRWYYLLSDGASAFETAGSVATKWKSLLPIRSQCRLAWERFQGTVRYGQQRNYALASLARFVPLAIAFVILIVGSLEFSRWRAEQAANEIARNIWLKFEFRNGVGDREIEGAWMLASTTDMRVRVDFVNELLKTREYAEHLLIKPDLVVQSLTGINPGIRDQVAETISDSLKSDLYDVKSIAALAIALRLKSLDVVKTDPIIRAIKTTNDNTLLIPLSSTLVAIAPRLNSERAYALAGEIIETIKGTTFSNKLKALTLSISALSPNLKPEDAYALARPIVETFKTVKDDDQATALTQALAAFAPRLKPEDIDALSHSIFDSFKAANEPNQHEVFGHALAAVARHLKPNNSLALSRLVVQTILITKDNDQGRSLVQVITALAPQLNPEDAQALVGPVLEAIKSTNNAAQRQIYSQTLRAFAARLKAEDAQALARVTIQLVKGLKDPNQRRILALSIIAVAPKLNPQDASTISRTIVGAIPTSEDSFVSLPYDGGVTADIVAVAPLLSSQEALALARSFVDGFTGRSRYSLIFRGRGLDGGTITVLEALSARLNPEDAYALAGPIVDNILNGNKSSFDSLLFRSLNPVADLRPVLVPIAARLKPEDAYALIRPIAEAINSAGNRYFAEILAIFAPRLKPEDLRAVANSIMEAAKDAKPPIQVGALAPALAAVASQVKPEDARANIGLIAVAMEQAIDNELVELVNAFVSLSKQLPLSERLNRIRAVLKYPTVYADSREILISAIKEYPDSNIHPPGDIWSVVDWFKSQQGMDVATPSRRTIVSVR
jgi:hypothetical protein